MAYSTAAMSEKLKPVLALMDKEHDAHVSPRPGTTGLAQGVLARVARQAGDR